MNVLLLHSFIFSKLFQTHMPLPCPTFDVFERAITCAFIQGITPDVRAKTRNFIATLLFHSQKLSLQVRPYGKHMIRAWVDKTVEETFTLPITHTISYHEKPVYDNVCNDPTRLTPADAPDEPHRGSGRPKARRIRLIKAST